MDSIKRLIELGNNYIHYNHKLALEYLEEAYELAKNRGDLKAILLIELSYAKLDYIRYNFNASMRKIKRIEEKAIKTNNLELLIDVNKEIGNIYYYKKDLGIAYKYYDKALHIDSKNLKPETKWMLYNNLGTIHTEVGEYDKAKTYLLKALRIYNAINDKTVNTTLFINIGDVYQALGEMKVALSFFEIVLDTTRILDQKEEVNYALALISIGEIKFSIGDYNKAESFFKKGIKYLNNIENAYIYADYYLKYAIYLVAMDKDLAKEILSMGINYSLKNNNFMLLSKFYDLSGEYYSLNDPMKGLKFYKKSIQANEKALKELKALQLKHTEQEIIINHQDRQHQLLNSEFKKLEKVNDIALNFINHLDLESVYKKIYDTFSQEMGFDKFGIGILDHEKSILKYNYFIVEGKRIEAFELELKSNQSLANYVLKHQKGILINEYSTEKGKYTSDYPIPNGGILDQESIIYMPLINHGQMIGTFTVQADHPYAFNERDFEYLKSVSYFMSTAITNAMITESLKRANNQLEKLSEMDDLTDLLNKRTFISRINKDIMNHQSHDKRLSLLMIDIDYFKEYNDCYGHVAGDRIIQLLAKLLRKHFDHENASISRFGGDEFMIFIKQMNYEDIILSVKKLLKEIKNKDIKHCKSPYKQFTISIGGVYMKDTIKIDVEDLIGKSDEIMYTVKNNKKNDFIIKQLDIS